MNINIWNKYKLWLIKKLLYRADAIICSLPCPNTSQEIYYTLWSNLGKIHSIINNTYIANKK